jgi:hypothetical protein
MHIQHWLYVYCRTSLPAFVLSCVQCTYLGMRAAHNAFSIDTEWTRKVFCCVLGDLSKVPCSVVCVCVCVCLFISFAVVLVPLPALPILHSAARYGRPAL